MFKSTAKKGAEALSNHRNTVADLVDALYDAERAIRDAERKHTRAVDAVKDFIK